MHRTRSFRGAAALLVSLAASTAGPWIAGAAAAPAPLPPLARSTGSEVRPRDPLDAADLPRAIHRLRVLGSLLYVGAHPDDENTALLTYYTQGRFARAAYL